MSKKVIVSAVSYLNSKPFVFGLQNSEVINHIDLQLDYPSECARKLLSGEANIGLVPAFAIIDKPQFRIISDYCIGANDTVRTVSLLSNTPLEMVKTVYLDNHSRTSAVLIKVLATYFWKRDFKWEPLPDNFSPKQLMETEALLAIGDKVFLLESSFRVNIDLATEWKLFTGLPMVFAVWASNIDLDNHFITSFNDALGFGIQNVKQVARQVVSPNLSEAEVLNYLTENISYEFNQPKRESLLKFYELARTI
jgi:chorismate dehydratase